MTHWGAPFCWILFPTPICCCLKLPGAPPPPPPLHTFCVPAPVVYDAALGSVCQELRHDFSPGSSYLCPEPAAILMTRLFPGVDIGNGGKIAAHRADSGEGRGPVQTASTSQNSYQAPTTGRCRIQTWETFLSWKWREPRHLLILTYCLGSPKS